MVLSLTIIEGPDAGKTFQVPGNEPQLIGRSSEALPISDTTVSRRHAELTPDDVLRVAQRIFRVEACTVSAVHP